MTEVVDKSLIERLILEHSDRLELEINQKARADAWKYYYRVRVDHMVRPFAVCKTCFRVLHCDSRSGTASLLRHPCNPLSERSPVNRAVKLHAKLNLPNDVALTKSEHFLAELKNEPGIHDLNSLRNSPVSLTPTPSCPSPTSTGSPPTATQPSAPTSNTGGRKRKVNSTPHPPGFPLDLRLLQLPQMMAAVAAHPLAALNLANATALLSDPQHLHQLQQQQTQIEHLLRDRHTHLQLERDLKRNRDDEHPNFQHHQEGSMEAPSSSPTLNRPRVKKERADTSEESVGGGYDPISVPDLIKRENDDSIGPSKETVQQLVFSLSPRVLLRDKDTGGWHYISDVWNRFQVIYVDGILRPFAACRTCRKVLTYTKYSGTGGLLRHRCSAHNEYRNANSPLETPINLHTSNRTNNKDMTNFSFSDQLDHKLQTRLGNDLLDNNQNYGSNDRDTFVAPTAAMAGVAKALLKYMSQDLVSSSTLDSPAFRQLIWTVLNLGAAHGSFREEEPIPSTKQLLSTFLTSMVTDSRESISKKLLEQTSLCLSLHHRQSGNDSFVAAAIHYITKQFELQSHAIGSRKIYKGDLKEELVNNLLRDFFQDSLSPSSLGEKHVTVVSDDGDVCNLGSSGLKCVWHSVEEMLSTLVDVSGYSRICNEVRAMLTCLSDAGLQNVNANGLRPSEVHRWESLLHAISFIVSNFDELRVVMNGANPMSTVSDRDTYEEVRDLLVGIRRCLMTVRDLRRPTLNQAVLCRAKLLQLCSNPGMSGVVREIKEHLTAKLEEGLSLAPLHLVASFLDPRCKSLKVLSEHEKSEVHRLVLEMMKTVSVTEANSGVLNLKTTRRGSSSPSQRLDSSPGSSDSRNGSPDAHPFREYMDNSLFSDPSVSDTEEIMAYVNIKVCLDDDEILAWWSSPSAAGLPNLRRLARKVLAVPATCAFACQVSAHALAASDSMGSNDHAHLNSLLHMRYNMS